MNIPAARNEEARCPVGFDDDDLEGLPIITCAKELEAMRLLVSYVRSKPRIKLTLHCLHLALGWNDLGADTMTAVASAHGVTKAAVSKLTKQIQRDLHLPKTAKNKSAHACALYAKRNCSPINFAKPT